MEASRSSVILGFVLAYLALCVVVGLWALRRTHSTRDFFMAGRDLGVMVTGLAVFSSTMSGFGFVGGPGLVYRMGMSSVWMVIAIPIGYCLTFFLLAKRIRLFAELRDPISLPDAISARYRSRMSRFLAALAILLGVMGYLATQILAMATVLKDILGSTAVGRISLEACVAISCAVLVFYCVTGGIIASVYTDLVQGLVMMVAAVLVFLATGSAVAGGWGGIASTLLEDDPAAIGPWGTLGVFGCLSWYFLFTLGVAGQPHVVTKLMMNRRVEDAKYILPVSILGYAVSGLLWISIGLAMRTLVLRGVHPTLSRADAAASQFLQHYVDPLLAGLVFVALFAAIMSTADGFLNIGAAAVVRDIPQSLRERPLVRELLWARLATIAIAVVASLFALYSDDLVALLGAFGWATFAAALVPTVAIGFNWKRATALAANVAILSSLVLNFSLRLLNVQIPYGIDGGALSLLVSMTLFVGISLLSCPPELDSDIDGLMDI